MAKISDLEIKIKPKFVIDEDTAYQCLTLLEMYCNSHNRVVTWYRSKSSSDEPESEWKVNLEFQEVDGVFKEGKNMTDDKQCCGTCIYHNKNNLDDWVCTNLDSENCGWTEYDDTCDEWEARDCLHTRD